MKRDRTYGLLSTDGGMVRVKHRVIADALSGAQSETERFRKIVGELRAKADRTDAAEQAVAERGRQLSVLRSHWWHRLGRALRIVR